MQIDALLTTEGGDILTTEGGDELLVYSLIDATYYSLVVDWDGDGDYDDAQEADRLLRWISDRGREKIYRPSGDGFNPYEIGRLTLTLDNHDGRYDPWNTGSPLYGDLMPGRNVQFSVSAYDEVGGHDNFTIFTGTLVDLRVNGLNKTVDLIVEDGWRFLADWAFSRVPFTTGTQGVNTELTYTLRYTIAFNSSTYEYDFSLTDIYPWGLNFAAGSGITDLPRHWWWDGTAKGAVEMIVFGALGRAWVGSDGKLDYANLADTTDSPVATLDEDILLKDPFLPVPWENTRSEVVLKGSNNVFHGYYGVPIVASLNDPFLVEAGETVQFSLRYEYDGRSNIYCTRIEDFTLAAFANANGTGTDLSANMTFTAEPGLHNIRLEVENTGATDAYITQLDVIGEPLEVIPTEWRFEAASPYRRSSFVLSNPWLSVTSVGSGDWIGETLTTWYDKVRIELVGESLLEHLATVKPYPVVQMRGRWHEQFQLELEDKVTLSMPTLGISGDFRVSKISHRTMVSPQDVLTTIWLYPPIEPAST